MILGVQEHNIMPITAGPCPPGTYTFEPGSISNQCDMFHFWSLHPGGASFLFADGSVHFLSYSVAPILPALASRAGGETASSWG
ncbi:MAG TPA: H-X9-DG-CTERM domain-containing protein [Gemmataceae bacterium]|nr:H-X9-DG-CTERM domain-containing protein [Gemmataceae bacterium]